ncbi:capsid decoration protein [Klebsiella phage vB_KpnS-VAC11]|uniref:Capsid decoration protein n=1 Tax=Klebsiella phage vB_KpnS-VAC11 TaxID=2864361 RepID=A0AAE7XKF1_9CAUD|nr:capsid decoration protein [Klebsiella phage vB_KpnS-VAC11]
MGPKPLILYASVASCSRWSNGALKHLHFHQNGAICVLGVFASVFIASFDNPGITLRHGASCGKGNERTERAICFCNSCVRDRPNAAMSHNVNRALIVILAFRRVCLRELRDAYNDVARCGSWLNYLVAIGNYASGSHQYASFDIAFSNASAIDIIKRRISDLPRYGNITLAGIRSWNLCHFESPVYLVW